MGMHQNIGAELRDESNPTAENAYKRLHAGDMPASRG